MAKASAEGGATHYVAEGDPVPGDLPPDVRLVGPGAPVEGTEHPADGTMSPEIGNDGDGEPGEQVVQLPDGQHAELTDPALTGGQGDGEDEGPPDYASYPVGVLRDLARERGITQHGAVKADLVAALAQWDAEHPDGDESDDGPAAEPDAGAGGS